MATDVGEEFTFGNAKITDMFDGSKSGTRVAIKNIPTSFSFFVIMAFFLPNGFSC